MSLKCGIVGLPNVGKSTLFNRMTKSRDAIVADFAGLTRDRHYGDGRLGDREFIVVDTGGFEPTAESGIFKEMAKQTRQAVAEADAVVFVVDVRGGLSAQDHDIARFLRTTGKKVVLAANKAEGMAESPLLGEFYELGLGEPHPVSAAHGRGAGDLLDEVLKVLPERTGVAAPSGGPRRVALVGKPNVGKSSLLNKLAGHERSVVDNVAGTTVDPVDELIELDGQTWLCVDTAGLRRKVRTASGHEYYASLRTRSALEAAEVAILLIDASEPLTEQDLRVLGLIVETGRALVIVFNKWDLVDEERRLTLDREIDRELSRVPWASRVNISAMTGRAVQKLVPAMETSLASWDSRISTGQLNNWLKEVVAATPPPVRGGKLPRILFATQATARPPTFVLFTTGFLEAGYRRFLERKLRETFGFDGTPIRVNVRVREKRKTRAH